MTPDVKTFFDEPTNTASHVVSDPGTGRAAIIDSVVGFDAASGRTDPAPADQIIADVTARGLTVDWILETHVHADHLSGAPYLKERLGGRIGIGRHISDVQTVFKTVFNAEPSFSTDGRQFDHLFDDEEKFPVGDIEGWVMPTPGHTPACVTYVIGDAAFVGDTLFMPDSGTARADFPGGDATTLYRSIQCILSLPPQTRLYICHDYKAPGRDHYAWLTSVAEQKANNVHVGGGVDEAAYVKMRTDRDQSLGMPKLLLPSIQVNMRAGQLPPPEDDGVSYLKVPVDRL